MELTFCNYQYNYFTSYIRSCVNDINCINYYLAFCSPYTPPSIDTAYTTDTLYVNNDSCYYDFYNDFNNAVNNTAMAVFLASVFAGILAVRAVIKVIKSAVR